MPKEQRAPGSLELVRLFVNSIDLERPAEDRFRDASSARHWLLDRGLPAGGIDDRALAGLRDLRETLRSELLFHTGEGDAGSWLELVSLLNDTRLTISRSSSGGLQLVPASGEGAAPYLRGAIAAAVYDAVRDGTWCRLKACRKHSCLFAFYDHSKNGSGTWCDMDVCGNRVKAQRRRARERADAGA
jgi:predicted RNA-binding Zn ribbon-like protein